ncbi:MAG: sensor histidine kinase [Spirochaetia bacterium]|nr:sensor histidine kinase [Spirochaetia bacterium]
MRSGWFGQSLFTLLVFAFCVGCNAKNSFQAKAGVLDARSWNPTRDGTFHLNGQWSFSWMEFATGKSFHAAQASINLPGYWNSSGFPALGYATYQLKVLLPEGLAPGTKLSLRLAEADTAYRIFADGQEILAVGNPSRDPADSVPRWVSQQVSFPITGSTLTITIHCSNYEHALGGLGRSPVLGLERNVVRLSDVLFLLDAFLFGGFFIIGTFNLLLFFMRRTEWNLLAFSAVTCLGIVRTLFAGERLAAQIFDAIPWELVVRLDYLSGYLLYPLFVAYFRSSFRAFWPNWIFVGIMIVTFVFCSVVIVAPVRVFTQMLPYYYLFYFVLSAYYIVAVVIGAYRKIQGVLAHTAIVLVLGFSILDASYLKQNVEFTSGISIGLFLSVFVQSTYLALRFTSTARFNEKISERLKAALRQSFRARASEKFAAIGAFAAEVVHDIFHLSFDLRRTLGTQLMNSSRGAGVTAKIDELTMFAQNIMDYTRTGVAIRRESVSVSNFIEDLRPDIISVFSEKSIQVEFDIRYRGTASIDPEAMKRVVLNLARNACNATHEDGQFKLIVQEEDQILYIVCQDNGTGMDKETARLLSAAQAEIKKPGAGFGLSVVRKIAEAHGGRAIVHSVSGQGTRISILIPLKVVTAQDSTPA